MTGAGHQSPRSIVVAFNDRINARDLDGLVSLMTDDHTFVDSAGDTVAGKAACAEAWRGFFDAFPDYRNVFNSFAADDGIVTVYGHSECAQAALAGPARWTASTLDGKVSRWQVDVATDLDALRWVLAPENQPACAALTPFEVVAADAVQGLVRLEFAPQPAFGNHFGDVQGGFIVAMLDAPLALAVYLKTGEFLPTVEIKTSFLAPARIGQCTAQGLVLRAGRTHVFAEAKLWSGDGTLAAHATATAARTTGSATSRLG
jgi:uncharacterized protein (TIGR00369 family)